MPMQPTPSPPPRSPACGTVRRTRVYSVLNLTPAQLTALCQHPFVIDGLLEDMRDVGAVAALPADDRDE